MPVKIESLEIHHIGISGGDATVIVVSYDDAGIMRQVKVLIDAGGEQGTALRLASYFATYFGGASFDYIIASHYHADHIAGFQRCGVDFKCVIDIGGYAIGNTEVRPVNGIGRSESEVFAGYEYYVGTKVQESNGTSRRLNLPFLDADSTLSPRPVEIPLVPTSSDITLTCYCAGGVLADGTNVLRRQAELRVLAREKVTAGDLSKRAKEMARLEADVTEELKKANPNDLSLAFLLEWKSQGFRYWTAGDLSGDLSLTRYANLEEPLIAYLRDKLNHLTTPITVMKATHHGSNHNNYPASVKRVPTYKNTSCEEGNDDDDDMEGTGLVEFKAVNRKGLLDELCPETIIIPCNQMKGVPGGEFVERLEAYCKKDVRKPAVYSEVHPGGLVGSQTGQPRTDVDTHDTCKPLAIFVNECVYPPQSTLQKANVEQLKKLAQSLGKERTNLVVDNVDDKNMMVSNDGPHAVVVFVPALRVDGSRDQLVFHRPGYSVLINNQKSGILAGGLKPVETGQVLPSFLADEQQGRVFAKRGERAEELLNLVKLGDRDFVDLHFPFIVEPERPLPSQNALADALGAVFREAYSQAGRPNKISLHKRITVNSLIQATTKFDREDENVMGHPDGLHTEIRDRLLGKRRSAAIEAIENTNPATGKTRNQQKNYFRKPKAKEKTNSGREQVGKKLKPNPHASKGK